MRSQQSSLLGPQLKPIGILGGGQLARMLVLKAHEMGVPVAVLSENDDDPAAQVARQWFPGKLNDREKLASFIKRCRLVTFESEFLDAEVLEALQKETGVDILPRPADMRLIQDRLSQKKLLVDNKLPTSAYLQVDDETQARDAFSELGGRVVFKKRRFGYDGYGTFVVRTPAQLETFLAEFSSIPGREHGFIAEKFIPFKRELAIMVARNAVGKTLHLPFVETLQEDSRCLWVKGPLKTNAKLTALAKSLEKFLKRIGYVGIMGIELFDTGKDLVINELAPRVHNSGHYSLDALFEDQFTIHLKSIMGCDLKPPRLLDKGFAMYNLLGRTDRNPQWRLTNDIKLHWYGKNENRRGRKMGHINAIAVTPEKALAIVKKRAIQDFEL